MSTSSPSLRLSYWTISPEGNRALLTLDTYLKSSGVDQVLLNLLYLRVSQINGCSFCVDLHTRDLRKADVPERKIDSLVVWPESPFFSDRERVALAWAESVTHIAETRAPDEAFAALHEHFTDREIVDLTFGIAGMNMLNRMAVSFRRTAIVIGHQDAESSPHPSGAT